MGFFDANLSETELTELIIRAQIAPIDNSPEMNEIVRRFSGRARSLARFVCKNPNNHDDVANAALYGLVQAVRSHDVEREGFVSYALITMLGSARRASKRLAIPEEVAFDTADVEFHLDELQLERGNFNEVTPPDVPFDVIVAELPERQRRMLRLRYGHDLSVGDIARIEGVTPGAITQRLKTAHAKVLATFDKAA